MNDDFCLSEQMFLRMLQTELKGNKIWVNGKDRRKKMLLEQENFNAIASSFLCRCRLMWLTLEI